MKKVLKRCACGRHYSEAEWNKLPYVGTQTWPWGEVQEVRNCVCGSTMHLVLDPGEPEEDLKGLSLPAWIRT